jgi:hypothetical protein
MALRFLVSRRSLNYDRVARTHGQCKLETMRGIAEIGLPFLSDERVSSAGEVGRGQMRTALTTVTPDDNS